MLFILRHVIWSCAACIDTTSEIEDDSAGCSLSCGIGTCDWKSVSTNLEDRIGHLVLCDP